MPLILLVALGLRLWPIGHGLPQNYLPDTHIVRSALGMGLERHPVPPVGRYSTYPYLLPYLLVPVYGVEFAAGKASGEWESAAGFGRHLYTHPEDAHLPARILVAVLSALSVWAVFGAGRAMGLGVGAAIAAWLVATGLLHVHFSVQERPWGPVGTFMAFAAWAAARHVGTGTTRSLLTCGAFAACALATHQAGLAALGIAGLAWLFGPLGWRGAELKRRLVTGTLCVALFLALAILVGHPYYLVHGFTDRGAVAAGDAMPSNSVSIGGQAFVFAFRGESLAKLSRAFFGYDAILLTLTLLGLIPAFALRRARPVLVFALLWALVFMTNQNDHVRYLLPLSVLCAWPAGVLGEHMWKRSVPRGVLLVLLALPLVQALRLGWVLRQEDTRSIAARELATRLEPGSTRLAIDFYGPYLEPNAWSVEALMRHKLRDPYGREGDRYERMQNGELARDDGWSFVRMEDLFGFDARTGASWVKPGAKEELGATPDAVLAKLGITHVVLVDRTPDDGHPSILADPSPAREGERLPPLSTGSDVLFTVHPADGRSLRDGHLPTEIDFPLTDLWRVKRPGPKIELFTFSR
ncbi:MAG: hypothetical protein GY711_13640 [bacterium]|nr:hypothetical protein [bacterium]